MNKAINTEIIKVT